MARPLVISKSNVEVYLRDEDIFYFIAEGNSTVAVLRNCDRIKLSFQLGEIEGMIKMQLGKDHCESGFYRGQTRCYIINLRYVFIINCMERISSDDLERQYLLISDLSHSIKLGLSVDRLKELMRAKKEYEGVTRKRRQDADEVKELVYNESVKEITV